MMTRLMVFYVSTCAFVLECMHGSLTGLLRQVERERKGEVVWVDLGGGTGANVEFMSTAIKEGWFKSVVVLDLAPSLCEVARKRAQDKWPGCVCVCVCVYLCAVVHLFCDVSF
jgi:hypothetical protein